MCCTSRFGETRKDTPINRPKIHVARGQSLGRALVDPNAIPSGGNPPGEGRRRKIKAMTPRFAREEAGRRGVIFPKQSSRADDGGFRGAAVAASPRRTMRRSPSRKPSAGGDGAHMWQCGDPGGRGVGPAEICASPLPRRTRDGRLRLGEARSVRGRTMQRFQRRNGDAVVTDVPRPP